MLLLDTNVVLRFCWGVADGKLGNEAIGRVDQATRRGDAAVSAITYWELALLQAKRRLVVELNVALLRMRMVAAGVRDLPIGSMEAEQAARLGEMGLATGDTADRFILATAVVQECPLLTLDQHMLSWDGPANCIDASR